MARIDIDTVLLNERGKKIINLTNDLNDEFNRLFKRIEDVPSVTKEWIGDSSVRFVNIAKFEKNKYYKFKDDLSLYGKFLCDFADSTENYISRIRNML